MEEMYGLHPTSIGDFSPMSSSDYHHAFMMINSSATAVFGSDELISAVSNATSSTAIKAKIASHPNYPRLLNSYIDCYKVVAPAETGKVLEEIRRESDVITKRTQEEAGEPLGRDPELDEFMDTYCEVLDKYRSDLSRPFHEAKSFLTEIETQLRDLCNADFGTTTPSEEGAVSSDEECSEEVDVQKDEDRDLKDQLLRRFGSHISGLRLEFSKKKKKGKLPKEATQTLFDWWRTHYKWPYPTEADKIALAETTGLGQRQINNWFINQRKRHWKPSEDLQFALMDNLSRQYLTSDT